MKVVRYGKIQPKEAKCPKCQCTLEYLPKDLEVDFIPSGYDSKIVKYIECPLCETKVYVSGWVL